MGNQQVHILELVDDRRSPRSETDMERARIVLPMLRSAILRYACGCRSRGICNHHCFTSGLALPDGLSCGRCSSGVLVHLSREVGLRHNRRELRG